MPNKSNVRKLESKPQMSPAEVQRCAEMLGRTLLDDDAALSLLMLLFDHINRNLKDPIAIESALIDIRKNLFSATRAAEYAQEEFQSNAYANRSNLLKWPNERSPK